MVNARWFVAFALAIALPTLVGCSGTHVPASAMPLPTSLPGAQQEPALAPMSIRGTLVDTEGDPIAGILVVLSYERTGGEGLALAPAPQDLGTRVGSWSGRTDDQGVFVLGAAAGQPEIHPSSLLPGNRYTLVVGLPPGLGAWDEACSPYVVLGAVYLRSSCSGDYATQPTETFWFTLEDGAALDLGTIVYLEEENPPCCRG